MQIAQVSSADVTNARHLEKPIAPRRTLPLTTRVSVWTTLLLEKGFYCTWTRLGLSSYVSLSPSALDHLLSILQFPHWPSAIERSCTFTTLVVLALAVAHITTI